MIKISQRISEIESKDNNNRTDEENKILDKFQMLETKDINEEERLNLLLDLCTTEEVKEVFIERYQENSRLINEKPKLNNNLHDQISSKPVIFPIGSDVETNSIKIVTEGDITLSECNQTLSVIKENFVEIENPAKIVENDLNLE